MATFEAGTALVRFTGDTADVEAELRKLEQQFADTGRKIGTAVGSSIGRGFDNVRAGLSRLGRNVATFTANAIKRFAQFSTAAISAFAGFSIKAGLDLEKTRVAFTALTGDAEKAGEVLQGLREFAETTPFQFDDIAQAGQNLVAFGTSADDVQKELKAIGDIAALTNQPISELAELYGKAQVQGRLFGEDINQLTGRGIPIIAELAEQFGVAESEVKELVASGAVGFENIQAAFQDLTSEGGRFQNGMEQLSQTVSGRISTLRDRFLSFGATLLGISETGEIIEGSFIDGLSRGIDKLLTLFDTIDVGTVAANVTAGLQVLGSFIIDDFIPTVVASFNFFRDEILPIIMTVAQFLIDTFGPVLQSLVNLVVNQVIPAFQRMAPTLTFLAQVIGAVLVVALTGLAVALRVIIPIVGLVINIFSRVVQVIQTILAPAFRFIRDVVMTVFNAIKAIVTGDTTAVINIFASIPGRIAGALGSLISTVTGIFTGAFASATNAVSSGVSTIISWFRSIPERILSALGNLGSLLFSAGADILNGLLDGLKSKIDAVTGFVGDAAGKIKDGFSSVLGIFSPSRVFMGFGGDIMQGLANGLSDAAQVAINATADIAEQIAEQSFTVSPEVTPVVGGVPAVASPAVAGAIPSALGVDSTANVIVVTNDFFNVLTEEQKRDIGEEIFEALQDDVDALGGLND